MATVEELLDESRRQAAADDGADVDQQRPRRRQRRTLTFHEEVQTRAMSDQSPANYDLEPRSLKPPTTDELILASNIITALFAHEDTLSLQTIAGIYMQYFHSVYGGIQAIDVATIVSNVVEMANSYCDRLYRPLWELDYTRQLHMYNYISTHFDTSGIPLTEANYGRMSFVADMSQILLDVLHYHQHQPAVTLIQSIAGQGEL